MTARGETVASAVIRHWAPGTGHGALTLFLAAALVLGLIAWASPLPDRVTDRDLYEATAANGIVMDCADLHCFRVLVPWVIGVLPGESLLKWKVYATLSNAAAAVMVWQLCLALGISARTAWLAAAFSLFGFGSLYTLHDVYTADPLMYFLGPLVTYQLVTERVTLAGTTAAVGALAKEFVAAPLFMFAAVAFFERRRALVARVLVAALAAVIVWIALQLTLMLAFNYGYGDSTSTHVLSGGFLMTWLEKQSLRGALSAMLNEYGAVYLLAAAGFWTAPPRLQHLALAAIPVALIFGYVQQPDRAWWNLHFIATPLAAGALDRSPAVLAWGTLVLFALANLRVGAQLSVAPSARVTLALSIGTAAAALIAGWRRQSVRPRTLPAAR